MKLKLLLLTCAVGLLLIPTHAEDDSKENALATHMDAVNDAFKAFRRETDPVKGATHAREAEEAALKGMLEIPERIKEMPESPEKAKTLVSYRKLTGRLYVALCEVEEAFLDGKIEEVAKLVESIKEIKKEGHQKFMKEDE